MAVRERELRACLDILSVTEHRWMDYLDGECDQVAVDEPVKTLCELFDEVQPDTVLTFGPDGQTGHVDHIAVSRWTTLAFRQWARADARLLYATIDVRMDRPVDDGDRHGSDHDGRGHAARDDRRGRIGSVDRLDDVLLDRKVSALLAQASQVAPLADQVGAEKFRELNRDEMFRAAESGRLVGVSAAVTRSRREAHRVLQSHGPVAVEHGDTALTKVLRSHRFVCRQHRCHGNARCNEGANQLVSLVRRYGLCDALA